MLHLADWKPHWIPSNPGSSFALKVEFGPGGAAEDPELYEAMHGFVNVFVEKQRMQESMVLIQVSTPVVLLVMDYSGGRCCEALPVHVCG